MLLHRSNFGRIFWIFWSSAVYLKMFSYFFWIIDNWFIFLNWKWLIIITYFSNYRQLELWLHSQLRQLLSRLLLLVILIWSSMNPTIMSNWSFWTGKYPSHLQLNEHETAPYYIQFSQNLTCDCLLIFVFSSEFPQIYLSWT